MPKPVLRTIRHFLFLSLCFLSASAVAAEPAAPAKPKPSGWGIRQVLVADARLPRVLLIGDSILNGYHAKAADLLRDKVSLDVWITPKHIGSKDLPADMKAIFAEHAYDLILFNDIGLDPEFNPLIQQRNRIATKIMEENHIAVADYYGILATKLDLAAGDRFHWTKPAYELLAQCAAVHIEQALPASAGERKPAYPTLGTIERLDPRFDQLVPRDATLEKLAEGFKWSEGPARRHEDRQGRQPVRDGAGRGQRVFAGGDPAGPDQPRPADRELRLRRRRFRAVRDGQSVPVPDQDQHQGSWILMSRGAPA